MTPIMGLEAEMATLHDSNDQKEQNKKSVGRKPQHNLSQPPPPPLTKQRERERERETD